MARGPSYPVREAAISFKLHFCYKCEVAFGVMDWASQPRICACGNGNLLKRMQD
jgi:hypothetical protein